MSEQDEIILEEEEFSFSDLLMNVSDKHDNVILPKMVSDNVFKNQSDTFNIEHLKEQIVLKIGCGSVGSHTIFKLNKMGVSAFVVFDPDILETHNSASGLFEYQRHQDYIRRGEYSQYRHTIFEKNKMSPFKVDWVYNNHLQLHDKQLYYQPFKCKFASSIHEVIEEYNQKMQSLSLNLQYRSDGRYARTTTQYKDITESNMNDYPTPTIVINSVDNLEGRLNSVLSLYMKYSDELKTLPFIDSRISNTLQGEVYCLDIFNQDQVLNWANSFLVVNYDSFDDLLEEWLEDKENIQYLSLTPNECGDTMSIISSSSSATIICSLVRGLFERSIVPNYTNVPYLVNFSFTNGFSLPYLTCNTFEQVNENDEDEEYQEDEDY